MPYLQVANQITSPQQVTDGSNSSTLYISTENVGVGTSIPEVTLDVAGTLKVNGTFLTNDPWFDVRWYGASGIVNAAYGTITSGNNQLTLDNLLDFQEDVQSICIVGAGPGGKNLITTFSDPTLNTDGTVTVTLDTIASTGVSGALVGLANGSIDSGSTQLNLNSAENFQNGQLICVVGAGAGGGNLYTPITSGGGTLTLQLQGPASTAVSDAIVLFNDRRAIQMAIDAATSAGGGTVFIPAQKWGYSYKIDSLGGTASCETGHCDYLTLVDNTANFNAWGAMEGDVVINFGQECNPKHCAGVITEISSDGKSITVDKLHGDLDTCCEPTLNCFEAGDVYCIPGLVMKDGVKLMGQTFGYAATYQSSVLMAYPVKSSDGGAYDGPIVLITANPTESQAWSSEGEGPCVGFEISHLTLSRSFRDVSTVLDPNDIALDVYNHQLGSPTTGPVSDFKLDRVYICSYVAQCPFYTGIRVATWGGKVENCSIYDCMIGIDLSFPDDHTNAITLLNNAIFALGGTEAEEGIGIRITGSNNRVIGGSVSTGAYGETSPAYITLVKFYGEFPKSQNNIIGVYFDGLGTHCIGVSLDSLSWGNIISGCHFDTAFIPPHSLTNTPFQEDPAVQGQNTFLSNGSDESDFNMPGNIAGQLGISYPTVFNGPHANLDPSAFDATFLQNSGKMLVGWNRTASEGETDFMANRSSVPGTTGGFAFYDVDNTTGTDTQLVRILGNGSVGIGTTQPSTILDVLGGESHFANGPYTDPAPNLAFDAKFGGDAGGIAVNGKSVFNGNVGIGTTAPASTLHVHEGKIVLESDSGNFSQLQVLNSDNSNEVSILLASGVTGGQGGEIVNPPGQKWFIGAGSYGQPTTTFGICNGAYEGYVLSALSNGNVGIGTTSPATALQVNGAITVGGAGAPQIVSGTLAPTISLPNGSLFLRTDGTGPNLYVRQNGAWVSK